MVPFCEKVLNACQKNEVERFLYQAGAFSPLPGEKAGMMAKLIPAIVGIKAMGMVSYFKRLRIFNMRSCSNFNFYRILVLFFYSVTENSKCLELLQKAETINTIGTRPGMLAAGPGKGGAKVVEKMGRKLLFADLAEFSLKAVQSDEYDGTFPFVGY